MKFKTDAKWLERKLAEMNDVEVAAGGTSLEELKRCVILTQQRDELLAHLQWHINWFNDGARIGHAVHSKVKDSEALITKVKGTL